MGLSSGREFTIVFYDDFKASGMYGQPIFQADDERAGGQRCGQNAPVAVPTCFTFIQQLLLLLLLLTIGPPWEERARTTTMIDTGSESLVLQSLTTKLGGRFSCIIFTPRGVILQRISATLCDGHVQ